MRRLPEEVTQGSGVQVAGMVQWDSAPMFTAGEAANIDRVSQFAMAAAAQAIAASKLDLEAADRGRIGVYWGTGMGGAQTLDASFKGLYGRTTKLTNGQTVTANMAYLLDSIRDPDKQIVQGYSPGIMSSAIKPGSVSTADAKALIAFIKTLK